MRFVFLFFYIIINVYFFIMNYEMFTITDYVNYGNGTLYVSPILFVEFLGLLFVVCFFILDTQKDNSKKKLIEQFETTIKNLKSEIEVLNVKLENRELKKENAQLHNKEIN